VVAALALDSKSEPLTGRWGTSLGVSAGSVTLDRTLQGIQTLWLDAPLSAGGSQRGQNFSEPLSYYCLKHLMKVSEALPSKVYVYL